MLWENDRGSTRMNLRVIYSKNPVIFLVSTLAVIGFFVYSFNLHNGLFWDDHDWIKNNVYVHSFSWDNVKFWMTNNTLAGVGIDSNYYRPFLFFTFTLNYVISGMEPLGYHLLSNVLHLFNGVLVFSILHLVFRRKLLAFLAALFFIVHPLQTEAVSYISGRGDVLVTMFMLLSLLLFYISESKKETWLGYKKILSLIFLVLGLLSRETGIIFPVLALALYVSAISTQKFLASIRRGIIKTWPYFAVVIVYGILRLTVLNFLNTLDFYTEPNVYSENLHIRIFTFGPILWEYLKLLVVPIGLHMERSVTVYTSLLQWPVWPVALAVASILYFVFRLHKKENSKHEASRVWTLGLLWFFIALGPVSGITPINALMYEHWLYMPMIGFWLIASFYLVKLFDSLKNKRFLFVICILLFGTYISFLGFQSVKRNILWGKEKEFYEDILKYEPDSSRILNNLGNYYFNKDEEDKAEGYYLKAVQTGDVFAQPYYNLGSMLQARGDNFGAIQLYEKAINIDPNFYYPYQALAVVYAQQGNLSEASENIEKLKVLLPTNARVYYNSSLIYATLKNNEQALKDLKTGLKYTKLDPETEQLIKDLIKKLEK
ncbi:MAG: tetratricopeptide repeat protein [bacterium]|nr:tetratricopeptide repeat protein [bacterium]